jgi:hypothetical protein
LPSNVCGVMSSAAAFSQTGHRGTQRETEALGGETSATNATHGPYQPKPNDAGLADSKHY